MSIEAFVKNMDRDVNPSNYEIQKDQTREFFLTYDLKPMIDKLGLEHDNEYVYLTYLNNKYRLNKSTAFIECQNRETSEFTEACYEDAMTIYDLLAYSKEGAAPSGELLQIQNLSRVQNASSYAGEGIYERYGREYADKVEALEEACKALGGEPYGKGDVAMRMPLFKGLYVAISFWEADDEFPPTLNIYVDSNSLDFMHYETIWYACNGVMKHISDLVNS